MKNIVITGVIILQLFVSATVFAADKTKTTAKCRMDFNLKGWSVFYKTAEGNGRVTCSNGQHANVKINVTGGGLSFGKIEILDGKGTFSGVLNIDEIFGAYLAAEAHAGAVKSVQASVYTKGEISLAMTGSGRGINIGIDLGKLEISKRTK
ncbi:MAG: hypothetical protein JRF47_03925 [Deltaproteobacteria bacterium]|nr:hypothetical protein [Deltaproteobacteria bacterium]